MRAAIPVLASVVVFAALSSPAPAGLLNLEQANMGPAPDVPDAGDRAVAGTMWFQGFLADQATGDPVNASYDVVAQMYSAPSGGTSLWGPETHAATPIVEGWFNIELGTTVPLPGFSAPPYYLQLTVNGEVLSARLKLASVPSSLRSGAVDTADDDWATAGSNIYRLTGNVGIGDSTPDGRLDVQSNVAGAAIIVTATGGSPAYGVDSEAFGATGTLYGVSGEANATGSGSCYGVYGKASATNGSVYGVYGQGQGTGSVYGVVGSVDGGMGVYAVNQFAGNWGMLAGDYRAVEGHSGAPHQLAGYFQGRVHMEGLAAGGSSAPELDVVTHDYIGVRGYADRATAGDTLTAGVYGETTADGGIGVYGKTAGFSDLRTSYGVKGVATEPQSEGVYGEGPYHGVTGRNTVSGALATLGSGTTGLYAMGVGGYAGHFSGDVYVEGKVGVGRATPQAVLDVGDVVRVRGNSWPASNTGKSLELAYNPTAHRGYIQVYNRDAGGGWGQLYLGDGSVGIGAATDYSHTLDVAGDIQCVALHQTSDDRLKTGVRELEGALDALGGIRGVSFEWNEESATAGATPGERGIGVLAGEVERVFPELVSSPEGGYRSVDYTKLTAVLIEAVKELRAENRALEERVMELEASAR